MMAGNPSWWSLNGMYPQLSPSPQFVYGSSNNSSLPSNPPQDDDDDSNHNQDFPVRSWSQLLMGGLSGGGDEEENRYDASLFQQQKKLENWEDQILFNLNQTTSFTTKNIPPILDVKQQVAHHHQSSPGQQLYGHHHLDHKIKDEKLNNSNRTPSNCWISSPHHQGMPVSSPTSCITSNLSNNNFFNFNTKTTTEVKSNHPRQTDHSSECNSSGSGGVSKKARVQQPSAQPALKVRKEKLTDRITALHQLVSPFGKTDTASVLSESIGYIRFLQSQIEALSSPYMRNVSESTGHHQHSSDSQFASRGIDKQRDLRSRGLCLVPISCTQHVGNDNGADYWAPTAALGGGF